jgi:hypothetical protein
MDSSFVQFRIVKENDSNKNMPHIKASLDKNKSQRMNDFSLK